MIYEDMKTALPHVVAMVRHYRQLLKEHPTLTFELEGRMGVVVDGDQFRANVPMDVISNAVELISSNPSIVQEEWVELQDFFYRMGERPVRTRVSYDPIELTMHSATVHKKKIQQVTALCGMANMAVRITLSEEEAITNPPVTAATEHVRIQQRKVARWSRERGVERPDWQYELSLSWSGPTKSEAERKQREDGCAPSYEIEVELVSREYVVRKTDEHIAASLILKLSDFLPPGSERLACLHTNGESKV